MFPHNFWHSELWKEGARAGLRQISKLVGQGNLAGASSLATTPGVLKPSAAGSQLKQLGRGSEGMATLVAHPEHGVAVRKLYDQRGMSTPAMIQRKEEAGRALGDNPSFAKFLGSAPTPNRGGTMHFNEYVPQAAQNKPLMPTLAQRQEQSAQRLNASDVGREAREGLRQKGYEGHDIRKGNMALDSRTGQHKVIDYMPAKDGAGEMHTLDPSRPNHITYTPAGRHLMQQQANQTTSKGMLGGMLSNKPMGVRRYVDASVQGNSIASAAAPKPNVNPLGATAPSGHNATVAAQGIAPPAIDQGAATRITKGPAAAAPPKAATTLLNESKPRPIAPPSPMAESGAGAAEATSIARPKPVKAISPVGQ